MIEVNPDALSIADSLDEERKAKGPRGPLHGIPAVLKDNIDTADRMTTTAGSLALKGSIPSQDAFIVKKLRAAGAIILGKANLSEWASFRSMRSTSGWSSRGGLTRNPYVLDRNPCGSSSGSAVAVAANLCVVAVGTETDGSVICPSQANSIVGIKPTLGLLSRSGIVPVAHSQDTAGPMGRTVSDAAILLGGMVGVDLEDPVTEESRDKLRTDYTQFLDPDGLQGARIGIGRNFFGFNDVVDRIMEAAIETMKKQGAEIVDPANIASAEKLWETEFEVLLYEFKANLKTYIEKLGPKVGVGSLKDVIEFDDQNRKSVMPYFGQDIMIKAQEKGPLTSKEYLEALDTNLRLSRTEGIDATMKEHNLNAIVAPSGGPAWMTDLLNGDHHSGGSSSPAAVAGYPNITVPAGYSFGLPVGISFFAGAYDEPVLIKLAYAFEQATRVRKPPRYLPTADLCISD
ncbi:MAG: amidase [Candidatus Thorarchaeota archaeon]